MSPAASIWADGRALLFRRRRLRQSEQYREDRDSDQGNHRARDQDPTGAFRQQLGDIGGHAAEDYGGRRRSQRQAADAAFPRELFGGRYGTDGADGPSDTSENHGPKKSV